MKIKELGDYTMCLVGENGIPWFKMVSMPYEYIRFMGKPNGFRVANFDNMLLDYSMDYLQTKDELILYFDHKISDKYNVNQYVNVSII